MITPGEHFIASHILTNRLTVHDNGVIITCVSYISDSVLNNTHEAAVIRTDLQSNRYACSNVCIFDGCIVTHYIDSLFTFQFGHVLKYHIINLINSIAIAVLGVVQQFHRVDYTVFKYNVINLHMTASTTQLHQLVTVSNNEVLEKTVNR